MSSTSHALIIIHCVLLCVRHVCAACGAAWQSLMNLQLSKLWGNSTPWTTWLGARLVSSPYDTPARAGTPTRASRFGFSFWVNGSRPLTYNGWLGLGPGSGAVGVPPAPDAGGTCLSAGHNGSTSLGWAAAPCDALRPVTCKIYQEGACSSSPLLKMYGWDDYIY